MAIGGVENQGPATGWTAWAVTWLSMLVACLAAVLVLSVLSASSTERALERALNDHLGAQAQLVGAAVGPLQIPALAALQGQRSIPTLQARLRHLGREGRLSDLAILGPEFQVFAREDATQWLLELAEQDLIDAAKAGQTVSGPLYRGRDDALYMTAYAPLPEAPGWVVAVEGSASSLGAVAELEWLQLRVGLAVLLGAGLLGAVLARWLVSPIRVMERELSMVKPGDAPERISRAGPRELRGVVDAARRLLVAIRHRDEAIANAHRREVEQMSRLAAEVAHEVRNPLNAMSLSVQRMGIVADIEQRARLIGRVSDQIEQLDRIVERLFDLSKPLRPAPRPVAMDALVEGVAHELISLGAAVKVQGDELGTIMIDQVMAAEMVRNLCLNAHQAGAAHITVEKTVTDDTLRITVCDDGHGISDEAVGDLFAYFHTTRAQGSGLGLPISRRMAEALGGSLTLLEPRPATFQIVLPRESA